MQLFKYMFMSLMIIALNSTLLFSANTYGHISVSKVIRVYDGDTITVDIKDYPDIIGDGISIRLYGIDTPEMRDKRPHISKLAREARWFLLSKISKGKKIKLLNVSRGKYFRIVGELYVDGENVGKTMIRKGLAKPYFGKTKVKW